MLYNKSIFALLSNNFFLQELNSCKSHNLWKSEMQYYREVSPHDLSFLCLCRPTRFLNILCTKHNIWWYWDPSFPSTFSFLSRFSFPLWGVPSSSANNYRWQIIIVVMLWITKEYCGRKKIKCSELFNFLIYYYY